MAATRSDPSGKQKEKLGGFFFFPPFWAAFFLVLSFLPRERIKVKTMRELGSQVEKGKKKWENGCSFLVFVFFVVFSFGFDEKM